MSSRLPSNRARQIQVPERFTDLTKPEAAARLTQNLQNLAKEVSKDRVVEDLPTPTNFTGESGAGFVRLSWGDVDDSLRRHRDCARIWRAKASDDAHTDFNQNTARALIVEGVSATAWYDFLPDREPRIYWLCLINEDGVQSPPAGGLTIAADDSVQGAIADKQVAFGDGAQIAGNADLIWSAAGLKNLRHASIGANAAPNASEAFPANVNSLLMMDETLTDLAGFDYSEGISTFLTLDPTAAAGGTSVYGHDVELHSPASNNQPIGGMYGIYAVTSHAGTGTNSYNAAISALASNDGIGTVAVNVGLDVYVANTGGGIVGDSMGLSISAVGGNTTNHFSIWLHDPNTGATNSYGFWQDSPGVFRIKYDGVMAYYNPALTKYTPGAANYECIVTQWNSNVAEIGTEAGGTGTQRALRLLGSSVEAKATGGGAYVAITASAFTTASAQGAFTASPYGTGAGQTGEMRFKELAANGVNHVGLKAPDALAADLVFTLPATDAAGPLVSDGSKALSVLAGANGTIVIPAVATLTIVKGIITSIV